MDVLTFGETMLRLTPPRHQRLAQASGLELWTAGSESNVAAGLSALGVGCTWVSRLPDNAIGHRIAEAVSGRGVDVSHVVWAPAWERAGLIYAETVAAPRAGMVIYDRAHSAAASLAPVDLPNALFDTHRHLHVSGITPALSPTCAETVVDAIHRARTRGLTVSFDVNYRAKLWPPEAAAEALSPLIGMADVLFCGRNDAARLFDLHGDDVARAQALQSRFGNPVVVMTAGRDGAVGCDSEGCRTASAVTVETTIDRFGAGDAFAASFLSAHLRGEPLEHALRMGTAAAALKRTIPGDMLIATRAEVEKIAAGEEDLAWR